MRPRLVIPRLGGCVPQRGNRFSRWLGRLMMRIGRWRISGELPNVPRCVLVVAPHSSNWDFPAGLGAKWALGLKVTFLGKDTLFHFPLGNVLRWLGGVPVDRAHGAPVVNAAVEALEEASQLWLVIAPEGTRSAVARWKTGFHRIALQAGVPVLPVALDWGRKQIRIFGLFQPGPDMDADVERLMRLYQDVRPRRQVGMAA